MTVRPQGGFGAVLPPRRRVWPWLLAGAAGVVVLLMITFVGWALLSDDDPPRAAGERTPGEVLPARVDVERITKGSFASATDDDPGAEPDEFRGQAACRTAWQPLRSAVVGGATVADTQYLSGRPENHQVMVGAARVADDATARSIVDRVNNDVASCAQGFFVREQGESNDWRVRQSAGEWYLSPAVAREGNWYCAVGIRAEGRYVLRALECRTGSNYVSALLDVMVQRVTAR